jgi:hypothetical protein
VGRIATASKPTRKAHLERYTNLIGICNLVDVAGASVQDRVACDYLTRAYGPEMKGPMADVRKSVASSASRFALQDLMGLVGRPSDTYSMI